MSEGLVSSEEALSSVFIDGDTKWSIDTFVTHTGHSVGPIVEKSLKQGKCDDEKQL